MNKPTNRRNAIRLWTEVDGELVSHFHLYEFENHTGLAMVHPSALESLELTRRDLGVDLTEEVIIIITNASCSAGDLAKLAARLGWTTHGGSVSRDSKHQYKYGGIAVDFIARTLTNDVPLPSHVVGRHACNHFDWVKDDYPDNHVHADNRSVLLADDREAT